MWKGKQQRWVGISDPYIVPEPSDGLFTMVLCARVLDVSLASSGCLASLKSRDLRHWEKPSLLAWPACFERMETPQFWKRHERWYLSFGGVLDISWVKANEKLLPEAVLGQPSHQNFCYTLDGPEEPADETRLRHIAAPRGHYIMKILPITPEQDVAIFTSTVQNDSGISPPYIVKYGNDQSLVLETDAKLQDAIISR